VGEPGLSAQEERVVAKEGWVKASARPYRHIHFAVGLIAVEVAVCHLAAMN
jgi:hypothetical protein